jgi:hypothetical protein
VKRFRLSSGAVEAAQAWLTKLAWKPLCTFLLVPMLHATMTCHPTDHLSHPSSTPNISTLSGIIAWIGPAPLATDSEMRVRGLPEAPGDGAAVGTPHPGAHT